MFKRFNEWRKKIAEKKAEHKTDLALVQMQIANMRHQDIHCEDPVYVPHYSAIHDPMGPPMPLMDYKIQPSEESTAELKLRYLEDLRKPTPEPDDDDGTSIVEAAVDIGLDLLSSGIASGSGEDWEGGGGESAGGGANGDW